MSIQYLKMFGRKIVATIIYFSHANIHQSHNTMRNKIKKKKKSTFKMSKGKYFCSFKISHFALVVYLFMPPLLGVASCFLC